ncbi:MAG: MFS transporter [Chloroflexi bacterium]|nr:MFS transporter [Chloroflexota bacterium]
MSEAKVFKDKNLQVIFCVTLMSTLGIMTIIPIFPVIIEKLQISRTQVGMLIIAYTLPGIILSPFLGVLADRVGRKRILVPSLFLFGLAGGACGLVQEFNILIALRVVQGFGATGIGNLTATMIGDLFQGRQRAEAMGLNEGVMTVSTASYPLIGGAIATFGWNYPFFLALAAIPIGLLVIFYLDNPEPKNNQNLQQYLSRTSSYFKNAGVAGALLGIAIFFTILYGAYLTYLTLFLGASFKASVGTIGMLLSLQSFTSAVIATQLGRLVKVASVQTVIRLGFVLLAAAISSFLVLPRLALIPVAIIAFGCAHGMIAPGLRTYAAGLAPIEYRAAFMSIQGAMLHIGMTVGPLVFGLAYVYAGFNGVFLSAAGLALATAIAGTISRETSR